MPSIRNLLPYKDLSDDDCIRVTASVSIADKRTLLASLGGDDGILSFVIQSAFANTATYIRSHGLNAYDPANYPAVIAYVSAGATALALEAANRLLNSADTRVNRHAVDKPDAVGVTGRKPTTKTVPSVTANPRKGHT